MSEQTADVLARALRRNYSGNWPLVMPSDLLALVEDYQAKNERIAKLEAERDRVFAGELVPGVLAERIGNLERDRALLLRFAKALSALDVELDNEEPVAAAQFAAQIEEMHAARKAVEDAGLLEGDE